MSKRPQPRRQQRYDRGGRNALLGWELLRVSRRTATVALARFSFGAAILAVMWVLWSAEFAGKELQSNFASEISKELQRFADAFSVTFFMVQLTLVLLLTPIFVIGSVFEERDTRSGEVLLTTDLTRREIFYGKLLARIVQTVMVVAAGMPILALTLLWGGVSMTFIAVGYVVTFVCIFSSGAVAASVAGGAETFRQAVLKAYGLLFLFNVVVFPASPYVVIAWTSGETFVGIFCGVIFLPVQIIMIAVSLSHGLRWLRLAMLRQRRRVTTQLAAQMARRKPPLPDEEPLFWKERHVGQPAEVAAQTALMTAIGMASGTLFIVFLGAGMFPAGWVAAYVAPTLLGLAVVILGLSAASSVARERHKNTLVDLFMIPGPRRDILWAKLRAAFWTCRWILVAVLIMLPVSVVGGTPLVAVPGLVAATLAFTVLGGGLGIWLSVRCRTARAAAATWMGVMTLALFGTFLVADALAFRTASPGGGTIRAYPAWTKIVNPVLAWQDLAMTPDDPPIGHAGYRRTPFRIVPEQTPSVLGALIGLVLQTALGLLFWRLAVRQFDREGRD